MLSSNMQQLAFVKFETFEESALFYQIIDFNAFDL